VRTSADQFADNLRQLDFVAVKTSDHGVKHGVGIQLFEIKRLAGAIGKHGEKRQLRTTIAFTEGVDRV